MRKRRQAFRAALAGLALALSACGGGSSGGPGFISPPPPPPPPPLPPPLQVSPGGPDRIIAQATTSQTFTSESPVGPYAAEGLEVRFDAATGQYHVTSAWDSAVLPLVRANYVPADGEPHRLFRYGDAYVTIQAHPESPLPEHRYFYSNMATYSYPNVSGFFGGATAFGIATSASQMPGTGSATYEGFLAGWSSERYEDGWGGTPAAIIDGTISLSFDFAAATLSGSLHPRLNTYETYDLGVIALSQPVWSGGPRFTAMLPGDLGGLARLTGTFTGPAANELIGSFAFGYTSPIDGTAQHAGGSYLAKPAQQP